MLRGVGKKKTKLLTVRFTLEELENYKTACESDGGTMSSVTRTFVFKRIRDSKERDPHLYVKRKNEYERPVVAAKTPRRKVKQNKA